MRYAGTGKLHEICQVDIFSPRKYTFLLRAPSPIGTHLMPHAYGIRALRFQRDYANCERVLSVLISCRHRCSDIYSALMYSIPIPHLSDTHALCAVHTQLTCK